MAPGKGNHAKVDREEELRAVVLADSFDQLFQPLALNKPRCLLPLCNVPMIEYTLEFLASSGVDETYILCQAHPDKLRAYIKQSKWARGHSPMKVITKVVQGASSVGDALREIDSSSIIRSDFILCTGVVVSNMDLSKVFAAHMAHKQRDKNQIMSMLLQEATPNHRLQDKSDESVYVIDPSTNKLLAINSSPALPRRRHMNIQTEVITAHPEVELRADLVDTHVAICSLEALALFTENFDYQTMRRDFIHGILTSDLLSSTIYAHILSGSSCVLSEASAAVTAAATSAAVPGSLSGAPGDPDDFGEDDLMFASHSGYAAGITDTAAYDAISRDLIGRWTYPLCPDSNPVDGPAYSYYRGAVYKSSSVVLGRESCVEHHVVLGPNCSVADFASVSDSVLGSGCRINEHAVIRGSYIFGDSKVGKDSVVESSILGERVTILDNVVIERGCVIGDDVTIGPNIRVKAFTRIARRKRQINAEFSDDGFSADEDDADDEEFASSGSEDGDIDGDDASDMGDSAENLKSNASKHTSSTAAGETVKSASPSSAGHESFDTSVVGACGVGYVWDDTAGGDGDWDDDDSEEEDSRNAHLHDIGSHFNDISLAESELVDDPPSEPETSDNEMDMLDLGNADAEGLANELVDLHLDQAGASKSKALQEDFEHELKLTLDRSFAEGYSVDVTALEMNTLRMAFDGNLDEMRRIVVQKVLAAVDTDSLPGSLKKVLAKWGELVKRNIYSNMDQVNVVDIAERFCALDGSVDDKLRGKLFAYAVRFLYEFDIIEDLTVLAWHNKATRAAGDAVSPELVQIIQPFVDWLNESDEESEDEDDEDESDE
ncbi:translation initiation factor eIF-2B epsilon subunit, GEF [Dipsacomyces acuminosporus]|nr:translation initiation factor eIF-2B epsilon subunit, GEF [Dipsacomyces acuminosporus]